MVGAAFCVAGALKSFYVFATGFEKHKGLLGSSKSAQRAAKKKGASKKSEYITRQAQTFFMAASCIFKVVVDWLEYCTMYRSNGMTTKIMYDVTHKFTMPGLLSMTCLSLGLMALVWIESAESALAQFSKSKNTAEKMKTLKTALVTYVTLYGIFTAASLFGASRYYAVWGATAGLSLVVMLVGIVIGGNKMEAVLKMLDNPSPQVLNTMHNMATCIGKIARSILFELAVLTIMILGIVAAAVGSLKPCPTVLIGSAVTSVNMCYMAWTCVSYVDSLGTKKKKRVMKGDANTEMSVEDEKQVTVGESSDNTNISNSTSSVQ